MERIKFRVWMGDPNDYRNGEMMSADVAFNENYIEFNENGELVATDECSFIMQFTGLLDKHGKEIYEGDILYHKSHDRKSVMKWHEEHVCFAAETIDEVVKGEFNYYQRKLDETNLEIIGSIYTTPELIK